MKRIAIIIAIVTTFVTGCVMLGINKFSAKGDELLVGDVNYNSEIDIEDAYIILQYYSNQSAGEENLPEVDIRIFDVNRNEEIDLNDAYLVLLRYSKLAAGQKDDDWPPVPEKILTGDVFEYTGTVAWNIRTKPSLDGAVISKLQYGEKIQILEELPNNWYSIQYYGMENLYVQITSDAKALFKLCILETT